jgi:hypothetical protein
LCAGVTTVHAVVVPQLIEAAVVDPNLKLVALVPSAKPVPVTSTLVSPALVPAGGFTSVTVGGPNLKWSRNDLALVPDGVLTVTSATVAAVAGGDTAVIELSELTLKLLAAAAPNETAVAPEKVLPVIFTLVPPPAGPLAGDTPVTLGAGGGPTRMVRAVPMLVPSAAKTVSATR